MNLINLLIIAKVLMDRFKVEDQMALEVAKVVRGAIGLEVAKEAREVKAVKKEVVHHGTNLQKKEAR